MGLSYLGQITSRKRVCAQNQKRRKKDIKFSESQNNWWRLNMFKATEVGKKIREINLLVDVRIKFFMQNFRPFYLRLSSDCHGTR